MKINQDLEDEINDFYDSNDSNDKNSAIKFKEEMIIKYNISEGKFIVQVQIVMNNRKEEYEKNIPIDNISDHI